MTLCKLLVTYINGRKNKYKIGILAYGSLIDDPGYEISDLIIDRIKCVTPFSIEFARLSSSRDEAPTLVPVASGGKQVGAIILVLKEDIPKPVAESLLWNRERHKIGSTQTYSRPSNPKKNAILIESLSNYMEVETVLHILRKR